jgi:hypothetical protein
MSGLKLMAELGLDGASFEHGFKRAEGIAKGVAEGIKHILIGAVGVVTLEQALEKTVETAKELIESSERLAIAPEQLQVMRQAARNAHVEFEKLVEVMEKLSVAREKALIPGNEGSDARRAFASIGVRGDQLRGMTQSQLLLGPFRNAVMNTNPEQLGIVFRELGIKAFGQLIPYLKTNFDELGEKMKKFGAIMDTETALKIKKVADEFNLLSQIITSQLGPALVKFAEFVYRVALKGLGGLAGAAAFASGATHSQSNWEILMNIPKLQRIMLGGLLAGDFKTTLEKMSKVFDWQAGSEAAKAAVDPWEKMIVKFEETLKELADEADKLKNPKPADFTNPTIHEKMARKSLIEPSDSLVRIGNFLGGNDRVINRLAEQQVFWLEKIHAAIKGEGAGGKGHDTFRLNSGYPSMMGPHFPHS